MAEAIVLGIAGNILSNLNSHVVQQIALAIGVKKDLIKLERTLSTINSVLLDADEHQLINNHELRDWVKKINGACYEADDVLDEFATEALRRELKIRDTTFKKVRCSSFFIENVSFRFKISRRIKEIRQKFDEIADDRTKFHVPTKVVDVGVLNRGREHTHSFIDESEVFGREGDKKKIINMLSGRDEKSVVAIIGMGGLGKSTLAQLVYNDKVVDDMFDIKMWVGVYHDFGVKRILEKIIKSATNNECPDLEMDQLRSHFQEKVKGKKFLLVLDDVWNEESAKWDKLKFVMSSGAQGSKVVVTTRSSKVASVMETETYTLEGLSSDDCWRLFEKRAFSQGNEQPAPKLVEIGKTVVGHCHGVPLAVKTLASLMRLKTEEREWEAVRDSEIWRLSGNEDDIMPVLRLSYNHLPLYLKQCFAFFASSSKDYETDNMIQLWIAHGLVRSSAGSQSLEDVGGEYVKEFLWRSLIQEPVKDFYGNLISFKVHDLVQNLARNVYGTEYFCLEHGRKVNDAEEIRYAELYGHSDAEIKRVFSSMPNLRGVALQCAFQDAEFISRSKCLRSLNLSLTSGRFPRSIGRLKHLRRLILQSDEIQTVPESITKLLNLQVFDLSFCPELKELPKDMGKMINLRHFSLAESAPLSYMPLGLKYLTSLRTLEVFFVGKGVGCKLNELYGLKYLEGYLSVKDLENVCDASDCAEVNLKGKERLEGLKFSWNNQDGDRDVSKEDSVDVLENLRPHSNLKILEIEGYTGSRFASWMMKPIMFPKLDVVSLVKCRNVESLPPFGELPLLTDLLLKEMDELRSIGDGGGNGPSRLFPSLTSLTLENLVNLESFELKEDYGEVSSLPSLLELAIIRCPKLETMLWIPTIERLEVNCCGEKLVRSLLMLPEEKVSLVQLKYLKIKGCNGLTSMPENWLQVLVSLEKFVIKDCSSLVSLNDECFPESTSLLSFKISKLPELVCLPRWIRNLTKLQYLKIQECETIIHVPVWLWELPSLRRLQIMSCKRLKSLPDGMQRLPALEELTIGDCVTLTRWPNGLGSLLSLKKLMIGCTSNLPSLPEELQQLTALQNLGIHNCWTMLALPEWLLNFTSLRIFGIFSCKNLQCVPDWFPNLAALHTLYINECDELTSRCQKGTGEDWPNIAHIPNIQLNYIWIQQESS